MSHSTNCDCMGPISGRPKRCPTGRFAPQLGSLPTTLRHTGRVIGRDILFSYEHRPLPRFAPPLPFFIFYLLNFFPALVPSLAMRLTADERNRGGMDPTRVLVLYSSTCTRTGLIQVPYQDRGFQDRGFPSGWIPITVGSGWGSTVEGPRIGSNDRHRSSRPHGGPRLVRVLYRTVPSSYFHVDDGSENGTATTTTTRKEKDRRKYVGPRPPFDPITTLASCSSSSTFLFSPAKFIVGHRPSDLTGGVRGDESTSTAAAAAAAADDVVVVVVVVHGTPATSVSGTSSVVRRRRWSSIQVTPMPIRPLAELVLILPGSVPVSKSLNSPFERECADSAIRYRSGTNDEGPSRLLRWMDSSRLGPKAHHATAMCPIDHSGCQLQQGD